MRDLDETAHRIEARSQFISQPFVLNKALSARRSDGLLVEPFGIQFSSLELGDLGAYQCGAILESLRTGLGPRDEPFVVFNQGVEVQASVVAVGRAAQCGVTQRREELIVGALELGRHGPKRGIARDRRDSSGEILHECACLQLPDRGYRVSIPIPQVRDAGGGGKAASRASVIVQILVVIRLEDHFAE